MTPEQFLAGHPLLKGLESPERTRLVRRSVIKTFPARATVFLREDEADGVYGILSGSVVVTVESPGGGELILRLLSEGQLFGELAVVDGQGRTASVVTRSPCTFLFIARAVFLEVTAAHPDVATAVTLALSDYLRRNTRLVSEAAFLDVTHRLARLLVELGGSSPGTVGRVTTIRVSQYELAGMLGVSREIVNRHLTSWRRSGLVETFPGRIRLLDGQALEALAREPRQ
jgi:CRP-like cAMP-binding protein